MSLRILIKGAGDLATGVAVELKERGHEIVMTEIEVPLTVRRQVACSRAVYEKEAVIENHKAVLASDEKEAEKIITQGNIAVLIDPTAAIAKRLKPDIIVDAIMAKKNLQTVIDEASCVIALGPGFYAGKDCHAVIETKRGDTLGQVIYDGSAIPNTGVPGIIGGYAIERLIKAAAKGKMHPVAHIGDIVKKGQLLAITGTEPVYAQIDGIIRGMLQADVEVEKDMKIGDVDPRTDTSLVYRISDKARKIGKATAEAIRNICFRDYAMVFLAAGLSSRYGEAGENKLLEEKDGKPMYRYLLDQMEEFPMCIKATVSRCPEILAYAKEHGMKDVENTQPQKGISLSLKMGLKACIDASKKDLRGVLFAVCDQPNLKSKTIERMLETAYHNPGKIICASYNGRRGNPVLMDKCYFEELMQLVGDTGGKQIIKKYPQNVILCEADEKELQDIDEKGIKW